MNEVGLKDQCFGVEVELTGITREQAAQALADYFGTEPRRGDDYYDSWYVRDGEGKEWRLMSDSSIRGEQKVGARYTSTSDPRYRVEMVTPKLTYLEVHRTISCQNLLQLSHDVLFVAQPVALEGSFSQNHSFHQGQCVLPVLL